MAFVPAPLSASRAATRSRGPHSLCSRGALCGRAPASLAPRRLRRTAAARACAAAPPAAAEPLTGAALLKRFIYDAGALGTLRFVAVTGGAVLETVGRLDYALSEFSVPGKGAYLSVCAADKTFECHVNADKVGRVTLSEEAAKVGGHALYVVRFLGEGAAPVLSVMLMWAPNEGPGVYLHGAVEAFRKLREQYGDGFDV
jgi:hypothetical protein